MSVEYYLTCPRHKEFVWVGSDGLSGPQLHGRKELIAFIIQHRACSLVVKNEHTLDDNFCEWDETCWDEFLTYEDY